MVPIGGRPRNGKGGGGQLAYQPLEHDHDAEGDEVQQRSPSVRHGSGSVSSPVNGNSGNREVRRAGSGSPTGGAVELAPFKSKSSKKNRYELLGDGDGDGDGDDSDDDRGVTETEMNGNVAGGSSAAVVRGTPTGDRRDRGGGGGEEEDDPGVSGQRGLLSTPNVKMILFIVAIVQVSFLEFLVSLFFLMVLKEAGVGSKPS